MLCLIKATKNRYNNTMSYLKKNISLFYNIFKNFFHWENQNIYKYLYTDILCLCTCILYIYESYIYI